MGSSITIRHATHEDNRALARLAALDEGPAPRGDTLLALVDGELLAAVPLDGGAVVADPFHHTAELVELLRMRAAQGHAAREARGPHLIPRLARA